ncbi:squalene cyclase [Cellulomonas sp. ATA003]|uniref:squalene cyclase n=1 Tax=Cellulomonas sp. ATA003 TaxID=3073064 RepID=UPI00287317C0|nr:squalene cyclase [Cellulomonas sp. ATA003]WNB87107.1 squalene cyclase [Cellulomonas sp. ATA003]
MPPQDDIPIDWLLATDPALRWQVERDVLGAPPAVWQATRARVPVEGFGARLLALQDPDGQWAGGAYFPGGGDGDGGADGGADGGGDAAAEDGQPWTATTWSLNALREWGVDAANLDGTAALLDAHCRWEYDGLPYWGGEVDVCINASTLANGAWLGADVSGLAQWFVDHRLPDGGWNCAWVEGAARSSFHSTLNAVRGLLAYEVATGGSDAVRAARHAGEEYLLERRLLYRLTTGDVVGPWATRLVHPPRWVYSVLHSADHVRAAALHDAVAPDRRLGDAVDLLRARRRPDGTWVQEGRHPGRVWFEVDVPPGEPSPWLTFLATRVLTWWDPVHPPG